MLVIPVAAGFGYDARAGRVIVRRRPVRPLAERLRSCLLRTVPIGLLVLVDGRRRTACHPLPGPPLPRGTEKERLQSLGPWPKALGPTAYLFNAACAAASLAMGTRNGEQDT